MSEALKLNAFSSFSLRREKRQVDLSLPLCLQERLHVSVS